jgi:hypothetical protein
MLKGERSQTLIGELRDFESKMTQEDLFDFQMLVKRVKDDEELDRLSRRRLEELHSKYVVKHLVKDIDALIKKYARQVKDFGPAKDKGEEQT